MISRHERSFTVLYFYLLAAVLQVTARAANKPNIVFLVCESTDGRTWQRGYQDDVIPLPNLRYLEDAGGFSFQRNYANSPVCCPSRASFWSGRHVHKLPHTQEQSHTNSRTGDKKSKTLHVDGVWNNFEGLPLDFDQRIDQILERHGGYEIHLSGKHDWSPGSHTRDVPMVWTKYARFPYNMHKSGGWSNERPFVCSDNGTVVPGNKSAHSDDWRDLKETIQWLYDYKQNATTQGKPFFLYQGMMIVHPPYVTNDQYFSQIDPGKIRVPWWPALENLHPCDLQSSMLKGCIPPLDNTTAKQWYYSKERRRNIRRIYYAMIAEFDAMVGAYIKAIKDIGEWENTVFIITSDHGDMQMEHQQGYKMVPYDASSSVPLVIYDGRQQKHQQEQDNNSNTDRKNKRYRVIEKPTQLLDIFPTIMELAGVDPTLYPKESLDGYSLVPLMVDTTGAELGGNLSSKPDFVVSQFHGMNAAMSWFLIVRSMRCKDGSAKVKEPQMCIMKLVIWGTGREVDSQLFDLSHDPDEMINLIRDPAYASVISSLKEDLYTAVDYPRVARDVARYNRDSMRQWIAVMGEPDWRKAIHGSTMRWDQSWDRDIAGAFQALEEWLNGTSDDGILACRSDFIWPPQASSVVEEVITS